MTLGAVGNPDTANLQDEATNNKITAVQHILVVCSLKVHPLLPVVIMNIQYGAVHIYVYCMYLARYLLAS